MSKKGKVLKHFPFKFMLKHESWIKTPLAMGYV